MGLVPVGAFLVTIEPFFAGALFRDGPDSRSTAVVVAGAGFTIYCLAGSMRLIPVGAFLVIVEPFSAGALFRDGPDSLSTVVVVAGAGFMVYCLAGSMRLVPVGAFLVVVEPFSAGALLRDGPDSLSTAVVVVVVAGAGFIECCLAGSMRLVPISSMGLVSVGAFLAIVGPFAGALFSDGPNSLSTALAVAGTVFACPVTVGTVMAVAEPWRDGTVLRVDSGRLFTGLEVDGALFCVIVIVPVVAFADPFIFQP
jgi:hypothetical protein